MASGGGRSQSEIERRGSFLLESDAGGYQYFYSANAYSILIPEPVFYCRSDRRFCEGLAPEWRMADHVLYACFDVDLCGDIVDF